MQYTDDAVTLLRLMLIPRVGRKLISRFVDWLGERPLTIREAIANGDAWQHVFSASHKSQFDQTEQEAMDILARLDESDGELVTVLDSKYPTRLKAVLANEAPSLLFLLGNRQVLEGVSVGFCGSRKASQRGIQAAHDCASQLAGQRINVVSGYAAGVDTAVHRASLEMGGSTTIVLPEGLFHFRLRRELEPFWDWDRVAVVSEFSPTAPWSVHQAMQRNSTICALSRAMVLVEAGERGGSVAAGKRCLELRIPLFAAVYDSAHEHDLGNRSLLDHGAKRLMRSRSTQRANLSPLLAAVYTGREGPSWSEQDGKIQAKLF